jgi:release factor glutamine methyltransferase
LRPGPYAAAEDTALLGKAIRGRCKGACLEIGAGNGGNLVDISGNSELAVGTDIVRPGISDWTLAGANYVLADRASCFREGAFDTVVFNPPYLRSEGVRDVAVDAGTDDEVPLAFLREALRVVKDSGRIIMLLSGEKASDRVGEECARRGFVLTRIGGRHLFYEELSVYEAGKARPSETDGGRARTGPRPSIESRATGSVIFSGENRAPALNTGHLP